MIGWLVFQSALTNEQGIIFAFKSFDILSLNVFQATLFLWVLCFACIAFVLFAVFGIYGSFTSTSHIIVDESGVTLNIKQFRKPLKNLFLPYEDIIAIYLKEESHGMKRLLIEHKNGVEHILNASFPNKKMFKDCYENIIALGAAKLEPTEQ